MRISRVATIGLATAVLVAGCSATKSRNTPEPCSVPGLAGVTALRANSVPVDVTSSPQLKAVVADAVSQLAYVTVFSTDGQPRLTGSVQLANTGQNPSQVTKQNVANSATVMALLAGSAATSPEANPLQAIGLAARSLLACPAGRKTLVVVDSGLQTVAPLRYEDGLLNPDTDSAAVAATVAAEHAVAAMPGVDVIWFGLGQTTGAQQPLTIPSREVLQQNWAAVLAKGGPRSVTFVDVALSLKRPVPTDAPRVTVVPVPALGSAAGGQGATSTVSAPATSASASQSSAANPSSGTSGTLPHRSLTNSLSARGLGFLADQTVLNDPSAGAAAVSALAAQLISGSYGRITIVGTTADVGDLAGQQRLARARAAVVRDLLVRAGVPGGHIVSVQGLGSVFPGFMPDHNADGSLNEALAAQNRLVIVSATS